MSDGKLNFVEESRADYKKVICLGKTFNNNDERREYFRNELRKKLPELKQIEGFPIGEDEDIIALSDPPYYTACPNPWLNDFIEEWEEQKDNIPGRKKDFKVDEPYASDISEGKEHFIYKAHSYHTKVPHLAIMRYILHYTQPGDIILDGFAGTGMTGVSAQMCDSPDEETQRKIIKEWKDSKLGKPNWGYRKSIQGDLSPIASFIAYNFNLPQDEEFFNRSEKIVNELEKEFYWLYTTNHTNGKSGTINFIVWSQIFSCPNCNHEINFFDETTSPKNGNMLDTFKCPGCAKLLTKSELNKLYESIFDKPSNSINKLIKYSPSLISYSFGGKRFQKKPDKNDFKLIEDVKQYVQQLTVPLFEIPKGDKTIEALNAGIKYYHQFYFDRSFLILKLFSERLLETREYINISSPAAVLSKLYRLTSQGGSFGAGGGPMNGVIYFPSLIKELPAFKVIKEHISKTKRISSLMKLKTSAISTHSMTDYKNLRNSSIDYIFTDPPFGSNLMYSELNFLREAWIKVFTNNEEEAIENKSQQKTTLDYQNIMFECFHEYYRVLKPGKWMTVEFSNTSAAVWNGIQTAIQRAGFIIANVAALDKKQGSFNAVNNVTSVKQDLIISCYKPSEEFEKQILSDNNKLGVWEFIREHLEHLPIQIKNVDKRTAVIERSARILYDRLITAFLMRGLAIPIDAVDFQVELKQNFHERDGMFFTKEQAIEYDKLYIHLYEQSKDKQLAFVFDLIYSESDAVLWLRERLQKKAQTYQDIMPDFRKANRVNRKGELVAELKTVLEENFIQESNGKWRVPNMNEAKDREALRNKSLLKEFDKYKEELDSPKTKKIKEVRVEALRSGFKMCWEKKDFKTIVNMGDKIPQNILLEDEQLLMYYDIAKDRI